MKVMVNGRNIEVTDYMREYVTKKVGRLERYLPQIGEVRADLNQNMTRSADDRFTAQITIWANGQILRAEESTSDIFASVDATVDKISSQIRRFKGRRHDSKRRASHAATARSSWPRRSPRNWPPRKNRATSSGASNSWWSQWTRKKRWSRWNCSGTISLSSTIRKQTT